MEIGTRVGAILYGDEKEVIFLGYGKYAGEVIPIEAVGILADLIKKAGRKNPKIELDSGEVVYGCECWWGLEDEVRERIGSKKINNVSINDIRRRIKEEEKKGGN